MVPVGREQYMGVALKTKGVGSWRESHRGGKGGWKYRRGLDS
jgi:hypothetical protein